MRTEGGTPTGGGGGGGGHLCICVKFVPDCVCRPPSRGINELDTGCFWRSDSSFRHGYKGIFSGIVFVTKVHLSDA